MQAKKSPEEILFQRKYSSYLTSLKKMCKEIGIRQMELRINYLEDHPGCRLPQPWLDHQETISIFKKAMKEYENEYQKPKP